MLNRELSEAWKYAYLQEKPEGKVVELWQSKFSGSKVETTDATAGLANVFAIKDKDEVQLLKRSAFLSATVMRSYAVPQLESEYHYSRDLYLVCVIYLR